MKLPEWLVMTEDQELNHVELRCDWCQDEMLSLHPHKDGRWSSCGVCTRLVAEHEEIHDDIYSGGAAARKTRKY